MSTETSRQNTKVMNRFDITKRMVAKLENEEAVIGGIGNSNFDLWSAGRRPQNFYMLGSMGLAIPIAFGVAIAQPKRGVVAIEGDGSILMQLGCLSTIAAQAPKNLTMIVMDNGMYQITGGQIAASGLTADIVAIARGTGIKEAHWAADEADFETLFEKAQADDIPHLIAVKIDSQPGVTQTVRDPDLIRENFMRGLGVKEVW